eukprot:9502415-Pyramimonas_sp.AAC.1
MARRVTKRAPWADGGSVRVCGCGTEEALTCAGVRVCGCAGVRVCGLWPAGACGRLLGGVGAAPLQRHARFHDPDGVREERSLRRGPMSTAAGEP